MRAAPPVCGLPGCKSTSQRALVLAALAGGENRISGLSACRDSAELLAALRRLGVTAEWEGLPGAGSAALRLAGRPPRALAAAGEIPAGEGASTLRFLMALAGASEGVKRFRPAPGLAARPHGELSAALTALGAAVATGEDAAGAWIEVRGAGGFGPRTLSLGPLRSSQTLSGLWMAAGDAPMTWELSGPAASAGYLELTAEMLRHARGADALVEVERDRVWRQAAGYGERLRIRVMADPSAAVFFAVAALLLRRAVRVDRPWTSRHADAALLRRLRHEDWLTWTSGEHGIEFVPGPAARRRELVLDLDVAPDCGPALAVLAAHLPAGGTFTGLSRLRAKESDRVEAMARLAAACGAEAALDGDAMRVRPSAGGARPGRSAAPAARKVETRGDHRVAMAAGVAALLQPGLEPDDRGCVAKSFPHFWEALECARG